MRPLLLACALLFAQASNVFAQGGSPPDQSQLIQTLMDRIEQLEKRVSELEGGKAQNPPSPVVQVPATPQPPSPPPAMPGMEMVMQPEAVPHPNMGIAGFSEGQFILHINSNLSPRTIPKTA